MYDCKLKGKAVKVQAGGMGLQVFDKSGKPQSKYLYQSLLTWEVSKKGLDLKMKKEKVSFASSEEIATAISDAMKLKAQGLVEAAAEPDPEPEPAPEPAKKAKAKAKSAAKSNPAPDEEPLPPPPPALGDRLDGAFDPFAFLDDEDLLEPGLDLITLVKPTTGGGLGMNLSQECVVTSFGGVGSCAEVGGVTRGSKIIEVNAREVSIRADIDTVLKKMQPGDEAKFLLQPAVHVALKIFNASFRDSWFRDISVAQPHMRWETEGAPMDFLREVRLLSEMRHPRVVERRPGLGLVRRPAGGALHRGEQRLGVRHHGLRHGGLSCTPR
jgi:hypothetical protein